MAYSIGTSLDSLRIAAGRVKGIRVVNKFGSSPNVDGATLTDIWDGSVDAPGAAQPIWLAPTAATAHNITSTADTDGKTSAPNSVGARTIRIYGLTDWDSAETSQDITLNGTTAVSTVTAYVIIHRMKVLTSGASGPNTGIIKATAAAAGTKVTAEIRIGVGQTLMAIYGVPSTQTLYLTSIYGGVLRSVATAAGDLTLAWCFDVENQPAVFQAKHRTSMNKDGSTRIQHIYDPPNAFAGPGILKLQATASANDVTVTGGFDAYLINNSLEVL